MKSIHTCAISFFAVSTFLIHSAFAQLSISGGSYQLQPNMADQQIEIGVSGNRGVQGLNFNVTIEDGFPDFGSVDGPNITGVDITTATIFDGNNTGPNVTASFEQAWVVTTTTNQGTVLANGRLATVTLDTTGFFEGEGPFRMSFADPGGGASDFAGISAQLEDGMLFIVPEPRCTAWFGLLYAMGLHQFRTRRRT